MLTRVIQVQVHLPGIRVRELAELEIDDNEASESSVEKQEINPIPLVPDAQPMLAPDKGEIASELEEESLEFAEQSVLKVALRVFVFQPKELQYIGVLDLFVQRWGIASARLIALAKESRLVSRERRSFIELGLNLAIELADRPATA